MTKKILKVFNSNLFLALILTSVSVLIALFFSSFNVYYATNDDYISSLFISRGYDTNPFLSYFLTYPIAQMQKLIPNINLLIIVQLLLGFAAFVAIDYVIIKKFSRKTGIIFAALINIVYIPTVLILIQFTHTTTVVCAAGYLCLLLSLFIEEKRRNKIIQSIMAFCLVISGSFYRWKSFQVVTVVVFLFIGCLYIVDVWKQKNNKVILKEAICKSTKKFCKHFLLFVLIVVVTFGFDFCSNAIKLTSQDYADFKEYNTARSNAVDYGKASYEGNEDFYNSVGIYSQNDIACLGTWYGDYDFFDAEKLDKISSYSSQPQFGMRFSVSYVFSLIQCKVSEIIGTGINPNIVIAIAFIAMLIVLVVIYKFRNKLKYVFPVAITLLWIMFFYVFKVTESSVLCVPICILTIITSFLCNRYRYFITISMNICIFALYVYLNFSRIGFRATYTFLFTTFLILLFSLDKDNLRTLFKNKNCKLHKIGIILISVITAFSVVFTESFIWNSMIYKLPVEDKNDCEINAYVKENDNKTYVFTTSSLRIFSGNYNEPLKVPYILDNTIFYVGWAVGSPFYLDQLEEHNIPHMYKDMIDNDGVSFVFCNGYEAGIYNTVDMIQTYYNDHYAEDDEKIVLEEVEKFDEFSIYNVITLEK